MTVRSSGSNYNHDLSPAYRVQCSGLFTFNRQLQVTEPLSRLSEISQ